MHNSIPPLQTKSVNIMIAEDDPGIVDAMKTMLELNGHTVSTTVDGAAVQDMKETLPDLLFLDIWMAGMDGREICQKLKSNPVTRKIPIIMVSANKDTKKYAIESGADDFLLKPFEMDDLLSMVVKYSGEIQT